VDALAGPGSVIVLTGPSSTGKTSTAERLRRSLSRPTIFLNGDDLDLPEDSEAVRTLRSLPPEVVRPMEAQFHRGYLGALAAFAERGLHAIGEVLFKDEETYAAFREACGHVPTVVVHLRCDREVREQRELARGDRPAGTSERTGAQEWTPPHPDLALDTTVLSAPEVAARIHARLEPRPPS
jgi:chloramphenicol 3-O-phosphotransferase